MTVRTSALVLVAALLASGGPLLAEHTADPTDVNYGAYFYGGAYGYPSFGTPVRSYGLHAGSHFGYHSGVHYGPHSGFHASPQEGLHFGRHWGLHRGYHFGHHEGLHEGDFETGFLIGPAGTWIYVGR